MALAATGGDAFSKQVFVGDEEVIADELDARTESLGEELPPGPVVLGHPVLDRNQRKIVDQTFEIIDHGSRVDLGTIEEVVAALIELGGGDIESEADLFAQFVPGRFDAFGQQFQSGAIGGQVGSETAFVADVGGQTPASQHFAQRVVALDPGPEGVGIGGEAARDRS